MSGARSADRWLTYVLRHAPESAGITLDAAGWGDVAQVLTAAQENGTPLTRAELAQIVAASDKQRFALDLDTDRIRANQGHSVPVDLGLTAQTPPAVLFHGTVASALPGIAAEGLTRRSRHDVHLSPDRETARVVGARRGAPVILEVDSAAMAVDGHRFYRSANGVWLTEQVPARYLTGLSDNA
jgi:putative RNA 2'-phosphotransferase